MEQVKSYNLHCYQSLCLVPLNSSIEQLKRDLDNGCQIEATVVRRGDSVSPCVSGCHCGHTNPGAKFQLNRDVIMHCRWLKIDTSM